MSVKQEQQEARTSVDEVAPGALRMQLPIAMPGLRHVNMYCFPDADGATVIDPGLPDDASWAAVKERLRQADLEVRHVHTVLITHSHPDHFGGAARFHAESGARVIAHESFSIFAGRTRLARLPELEVSVEDLAPRPVERLSERALDAERDAAISRMRVPWGSEGPEAVDRDRKHWERIRSVAANTALPPLTHVVRHGDAIALGGRRFHVVHSPGHTADHICFHDRESGLLIGGDHVLPTITPHISGLGSIDDPLRAFYDSLDSILELGSLCRCLPAHGDSFDDVEGRVRAIKDHHSERLNTLTALTKQRGPASVGDLSRALFRERSWGIMAESETYAHLEHLRLQGRVECQRRRDGVLLYVA